MKKLTFLIFIISLIVLVNLSACSSDSDHLGAVSNVETNDIDNDDMLDTVRHYHTESFRVDFDFSWGGEFFSHNQQLYLYLLEMDEDTWNTHFVLFSVGVDGTNERELYRVLLDEYIDFFHIIGFEKHEDAYASLITVDSVVLPPYTIEEALTGVSPIEINQTYVYRRISPDGEIVSAIGIDTLNYDERQFLITDIVFDLDGTAVASVSWFPADFAFPPGGGLISEGIGGRSFLIFDNGITGDFHKVENQTLSGLSFNRTYDGQIIAPSNVWSPGTEIIMHYEIDIENAAIIDGPIIEADNAINGVAGVFPAPQSSMYDYYFLGNDRELFGYRRSDETFTTLLDFPELGINLGTELNRNSFFPWDDGRITIANREWNASLRQFDVVIFLLTPSDEPLSDTYNEREIISFGGIDVDMSPLVSQVGEFNRTSSTHRIELLNYSFEDMDRLRTELITGRGPDIILLSGEGWGAFLVAALAEGHFMLDLYEMIDSDPILSREDFFPSILSTWENSRGELVQIAPHFSIQSIIGMYSVFSEAPEDWNYAAFIAFYNESREAGIPYPFGQAIDRLLILEKLLFADDTFFSERDGIANFDGESFVDVLNFVMTIPEEQGWEMIPEDIRLSGQWDPVADLIRGEQLLLPFANIIDLMHFRELQFRLGGITAFGFPTSDAPIHATQVPSGTALGIRSNSPHTEAAWEFVRMGLLPDTSHNGLTFTTRIDLFEQLISDELTRAEPTTFLWTGGMIELPPMTEADADVLRELIPNIGHMPIHDHPVQDIVNEDVQVFFAGLRSAEDTARIIQSRVQRLLDERAR